MWKKLKQDFKERFLNFETAKGIYLLPAGCIGIFICWYYQQYFVQAFGTIIFGYMVYEGLRKIMVNRVKQAKARKKLFEEREALDVRS